MRLLLMLVVGLWLRLIKRRVSSKQFSKTEVRGLCFLKPRPRFFLYYGYKNTLLYY
jgi:hypothetical protein